ncbi:MAG TPA: hypothetical protein VFA46_13265 [Actinomycetes bacterium]|nr:hypothetical protein [Actinomycetes bacterium]
MFVAPAGLPEVGRDWAAALLRPDGFIGWSGDDPHDLEKYLAAVRAPV